MGQIITFPAPPTPYPDRAADLATAECVLLIAMRWWVASYRLGEDPMPRLCQGLETAGVPDSAFSVDALMAVIARAGTHPIDVRCPRCPNVSFDEKCLLQAASLTQAGDSHLAEQVLRVTLLSAQGAEFAIGPLEGAAELFSQVRLILKRRRSPIDGLETDDDSRQSWSPTRTLH